MMAHKWLEAELAAGSSNSNAASSSSSSSSQGLKKGPRSQYERKLGEFFKHQIESDMLLQFMETGSGLDG